MTNPYKKRLNKFFEKLLYYQHISGRINKVFEKEIQEYSSDNAIIHFASALIISDWTSPADNGSEINFHSGITLETTKDNYKAEIEEIFSRQLCLLYAQSFESFERYLKDCLFDRISRDDVIREYVIKLFPKNQTFLLTRENMLSGDNLFKVLKKAGGDSFKDFSSVNNLNIRFKELWTILSEVRHSVTHNESLIGIAIVNKSNHHNEIFNFLFNSKSKTDDTISIALDYKKFERLIKRFSEFAYQVFKILSKNEELEFESNKTTHNN